MNINIFIIIIQGRIQEFAQGGGRYKIHIYTARSVVPFSLEARKFFGGSVPPPRASFAPTPPINIIMINTFGKTHIKKWSDQLSEPLRKRTGFSQYWIIGLPTLPSSLPSLAAVLGPLAFSIRSARPPSLFWSQRSAP